MNALELDLECDQASAADESWRVWDRNTGAVISQNARTAEVAWADAAGRLARCLSEIRRSVCNLE